MYRGDAPDLEHIVETDEQPRLIAEGERRAGRSATGTCAACIHATGKRYCLVSIYVARSVFDLAPERFRRELVDPAACSDCRA